MHRRESREGKANLLWFVIFFVALQLALAAVIDWHFPRLYDEEYGVRLAALQERRAAEPERPLLLVVGSSRVGMGFAPDTLPALRTAGGRRALPFTFSHLAGGPLLNLVLVHRLLGEGIRPDWLVVEVMPGSLAHESPSMAITAAAARDLPVLWPCVSPGKLLTVYARQRLIPWYKHRLGLLREIAPSWAPLRDPRELITLTPLGGDRSWLQEIALTPAEVQRRTAFVHDIYFATFQNYHLDRGADRALRALLDLCRREQLNLTLLVTPESTVYRSWYSAAARLEIDQYLAELSRAYDVPVIDARTWLPDGDFADSHHPLQRGAEAFTKRLGLEVLEPLVQGRLAYHQLLTAR